MFVFSFCEVEQESLWSLMHRCYLEVLGAQVRSLSACVFPVPRALRTNAECLLFSATRWSTPPWNSLNKTISIRGLLTLDQNSERESSIAVHITMWKVEAWYIM